MKMFQRFLILSLVLVLPTTVYSQEAEPEMEILTEAPPPSYPNLKIGGFTDFTFSASDSGTSLSNSGFSEGQFALHLTSALSERLSFFGELTLTATTAGAFTPTVERTIVRYDHSDLLKISLGRYHTPINYWNTAFHHGQWLQTTASRPDMTRFGGAFIPVHFVGGLLEGSTPAKGLNLNYQFGVGNGRNTPITLGGDGGDINNSRAWLANVFIRPDRFFPLQVGGSFYRDKITTVTSTRQLRESISSAHIAWTKETPEIIAEYANIYHRDLLTARPYNSHAYYVQIAYRLPWWKEKFKPYARFEDMKVDRLDPAFATTAASFGRRGSILGLRYDFADLLAIKGEWRHQKSTNERDPWVNSMILNASYAF